MSQEIFGSELGSEFGSMFILFAQHGWADSDRDIRNLARSLVSQDGDIAIYAPNLGLINTWLQIDPLIDRVEQVAQMAIAKYPDLPWRIVAHSMGGLIWLEVLTRNPQWWSRVHSLVLIGSPVGGSDLGRLFDPFRLFPLIARDLGRNRRPLAEAIAAKISTLSIISDIGHYTDGIVPLSASQFAYAQILQLQGLRHATLKNHPQVAAAIQQFWQDPVITAPVVNTASQLIAELRSRDLTETDSRNFVRAKAIDIYDDGTKLWQWENLLKIKHFYVSVPTAKGGDRCIYSAYAGF
jgi:pimeloyl-ACP methyl ester carboxylesterase